MSKPRKVEEKPKFYRLDAIKQYKAIYNMIIGERSNGKSFSVLEEILKRYLDTGEKGAIIRRWDTDFKAQRGQQMFAGLIKAGVLTNTPWEGIQYRAGQWTLYYYDEDLEKKIYDRQPFAYAFALNTMEHDKSTNYDDVTTILFDEFLTRNMYLPDEFVLFMNTLSTIIRYRDNVTIYMCANTVTKDAPYFKEMGLKHIKEQTQGTIELYTYGDSELKVAVEYCASMTGQGSKKSNKYFAFDNAKLKMITSGAWEVALYPHIPVKFKPKDIRYTYFVLWEDAILQCEIVRFGNYDFTYIHQKTTELQSPDKDLIFSREDNPLKNWRKRITAPTDKRGQIIYKYFKDDKVFYQDNEIGEIMRNYLTYCKQYDIIRE